MDIASIIGIIVAFGCVALGYTMDGGGLGSLWLLSALIITGGGTVGAVTLSYGINQIKRIPSMFAKLFVAPKSTLSSTIDLIVHMAEIARREGILRLENQLNDTQSKTKVDPLLKRGLLMVVDGSERDQIREFLEMDIDIYEHEANTEISMLETFATYAPAYGMIGTIVGLIQVLSNMESPEQMAGAMAVAFITTLYGSLLANGLFLPVACKLRTRLGSAMMEKEMIIEGVCSIQSGMNPKMLRDKLSVYLQIEPQKSRTPGKKGKEAPADAKTK